MEAPKLHIPKSNSIVQVSIIDTGARLGKLDTTVFFEPIVGGFTHMRSLSLSYLIEHTDLSGNVEKYLFDLSIRKDWENSPPAVKGQIAHFNCEVYVPDDVLGVLGRHGIQARDINGIIWSHSHWDHTGDPQAFPESTALIVGPGFQQDLLPGFPTNPQSTISENAWSGRELREIEFNQNLTIEGYDAVDFFGDDSFYLLNTPGHAIGHMSALARTTPTTFILLAADTCHHGGVIRPSPYLNIPDSITPNPYTGALDSPCPGSMFIDLHPERKSDKPFHSWPNVRDGSGLHHCREDGLKAQERLIRMDASDDVFVSISHDMTVAEVVDLFPAKANGWQVNEWDKKARWGFSKDYGTSSTENSS